MKVLILQGLPGSGKTFWAKDFCEKNVDWVRVCRDDLRNMRGHYWLPKQEDLITSMEVRCIHAALYHGKNVIVDAVNLNPKFLALLKESLNEASEQLKIFHQDLNPIIKVETKFFDTPIEKCIENDLKRSNSVGEKIIQQFYDRYLKTKVEKIKQDVSLPHIIICDLDGTLAIHNGRGAFEYDRCDTDLLNEPVFRILDDWLFDPYSDRGIIFLSGREDFCKEKTLQWLIKNKVPFNDKVLFMRKTGDFRKDIIVKKEIFDAEIRDKYYVEFVLDDRTQVVQMWRDMGLTCLQVIEGDF